MKNDQRVDPLSDAFEVLFELSDSPAAVCDSELHVLAANKSFQRLCGVENPLGYRLDCVLQSNSFLLPDCNGSTELIARGRQGEAVRLVLARRGDAVAVLPKPANGAFLKSSSSPTGDESPRSESWLLELGLEDANALILATDRRGRIRVFNRLLANLTGWTKSEVLGTDLLALVPESERLRLAQVLAATVAGEQVSNFETRVCQREGREVSVSLASSPVIGPQGQVDGMIAIGQDITAVKELERRIIHAEKLASLGQLAASVAHEINNPLTTVASYTDALLARSINCNSSDQEKLRKILDACERILRFTRQLVTYARPSQDKLERVQLNKLLDTAVSYCDHVLSHYGIAVEKDYWETPELSAIKANLTQVFVNLITNACQAMQPGGVIRLSTRLEGQSAVVRIADNGAGIDSQTLNKVFEPFFTTKPDGKGTGLGLSIAQHIVESHGGRIEVESAVGVGTTFLIRLPTSSSAEGMAKALTVNDRQSRSATC